MGRKIQLRRGLKADLPTLDNGEVGFDQDTEELFIGSSSGNKKLTFDATKYDSYDAQLAENVKQPVNFAFSSGSTNNTSKIQTALQDSTAFRFPEGEYQIVNTKVTVTTPTYLVGDGDCTVIKINSNQLADGTRLVFKDVDGIVIKNIKLSEINAVLGRHNVYGTLSFENCKNIYLENVVVDGSNGAGIHGIKCENVTLVNCKVHNTKADGVHFQRGSKNVKFINCDIQYNEDDSIGFVSHDYEGSGRCDGLEVISCKLGNNLVTGSGVCADGSINVKIHDNDIRNTQLAGVRINPITEAAQTQTAFPENIEVYNNHIDTTGLNDAVDRAAFSVYRANNVKIEGNISKNTKGHIWVLDCEGYISIKNNEGFTINDRNIWVTTLQRVNTFAMIDVIDNLGNDFGTDGIFIDCTSFKADVVRIRDNNLNKINSDANAGIYRVRVVNAKTLVYHDNIIQSDNTVLESLSADNVRKYNNLPASVNDSVYIGETKHGFGGSAPGQPGMNGEVVWNWNPTNGGKVGWIYTASGGWQPFGAIG